MWWCIQSKPWYGRSMVQRAPRTQVHSSSPKCGRSSSVCWSQVYMTSQKLVQRYDGQYIMPIFVWVYSSPASQRPTSTSTTPKVEAITRLAHAPCAGKSFELGRKWSGMLVWRTPSGVRRAPVALKAMYIGQPKSRCETSSQMAKASSPTMRWTPACCLRQVRLGGTWVSPSSMWLVLAWCLAWEYCHEKYGTRRSEWSTQPTESLM
mmetsp:Transcript_5014/g.10210  ORF Transcript_5014/g.10210 Transcript_5014/m.10210 type:complete len:207 (+) Transcript_5014:839-1459(+)